MIMQGMFVFLENNGSDRIQIPKLFNISDLFPRRFEHWTHVSAAADSKWEWTFLKETYSSLWPWRVLQMINKAGCAFTVSVEIYE